MAYKTDQLCTLGYTLKHNLEHQRCSGNELPRIWQMFKFHCFIYKNSHRNIENNSEYT
jgi:hypothetical protein